MSLSEAAGNIKRWRENPRAFVYENFGAEPDEWQSDALRAFPSQDPEKIRISLQACAGPGKSAVLAWCGWNFLACYGDKGNHPNGAAMSVSEDNLKDNLWKEFAVWHEKSDFLKAAFTHTAERIFAKDHPKTWFISARTWSKKANAEEQGRTLSGLHSKYILYLIDESGDISPAVLRSAEQGLSNCAWGKIMQAGNPTSLEGMLHIAATSQRHLWHTIRITGDPDRADRSPRINVEWAREQIKLYGRDNPWVMSYILGLFPPASINSLIGADEVEAAMERGLPEDVYSWSQKRLGIDVARFGDDRTAICPRQGLRWFSPVIMRHNVSVDKPSVDIANRVMMARQKWMQEINFFDDTVGWAHGAIDICRSQGLQCYAVDLSSTRVVDPKYYNVRAYVWLKMIEGIRAGAALPKIPGLVRELTAPTYTFQNGKFLVEPKDQIKKRLGYSPDIADGYAMTYAMPDMPGTLGQEYGLLGQSSGHQADYDPHSEGHL